MILYIQYFKQSIYSRVKNSEATGSNEASAPAASNGAGKDESFITSSMSALAPKATLI